MALRYGQQLHTLLFFIQKQNYLPFRNFTSNIRVVLEGRLFLGVRTGSFNPFSKSVSQSREIKVSQKFTPKDNPNSR